ncbi:lytic murein transglycosylase [Piscirickettsia salmonis]|uniref:Membrane-bound lytic murein transglycosylase B n=2 Tax=Piscirickettsia salmonis TaxID=1238 RepID=A0A9Q6LV59_PISSA|nr:lytic murein transglycosylase B [Piscirickettsia salmonis]ALA23864.1 lytic murein transglycosylase B MltB [Piscirickettsia salmonis]APS44284.1 lytic murein transglycosylase [Piscirickettsia salmonis]APS47644.1 lytic murein transglycosylase [Piscirickettsia salmonis]APS50924.1 lytic murein transglycosylase [Piscirickettsia salmonis]APS54129.1 lytic murein transglycosylase [Piscirickettsia salmonis]
MRRSYWLGLLIFLNGFFITTQAVSNTLAVSASTNSKSAEYIQRADVKSYINDLVKQYGFSKAQLERWFHHAKANQRALEILQRPAEKVWTWQQYRSWLVSTKRAKEGAEFWQSNRQTLRRAERMYGVPPQVILAIIGVESSYGKNVGGFPTFNVLTTLAFDYKRRSEFFKRELTEFLLLMRDQKMNPMQVQGSYAGALGLPQFMPSSYRYYAVDFSGDGHKNLFSNDADVIGSIGNYFKRHGWQGNQPIAVKAKISGDQFNTIIKMGIEPKYTVTELAKFGIQSQEKVDPSLKAALIELDGKNGPEYWLAFQDFYAITRYNHSQKYAMAVYDLSQDIAHYRHLALKESHSKGS